MRPTVMRYINLSIAMTLMAVSPRVKKRFSTLGHLKEAGAIRRLSGVMFNLFIDIKTIYGLMMMTMVMLLVRWS